MDIGFLETARIILEENRIITDTSHWLWQGAKTTAGYGIVVIQGSQYYTHRLSAAVYKKFDFELDGHILHIPGCVFRNCFNPDHIYIGDNKINQENRSDLVTHCKAGHEFNEENTYIATNGKYPKRQCRRCKADREAHRRRSRVTMLGGAFSEKLK